jgi:hypothetical protein
MEIITRKAAIQKSLSAIGKKNGSAPPESSSNTFGAAYELFVASELRSAANKRYDAAKAEAAKVGVIDEDKTIEGSEIATHVNKYFDVTMKKAASSLSLDKTLLRSALMKQGWTEAKVDALIERSSKPRKGAVTIGFTLKG